MVDSPLPPPPPPPSTPADQTDQTDTPSSAGRGRLASLWRRTRRSHWPLLIIGLMMVGSGLTYLVAPPTATEQVVSFAPDAADTESDTTMPSVVGLNFATAELVFADAGLAATDVVTVDEPAAGAPGRVLSQSPAFGEPVEESIRLTVSAPVTMPKVVGNDYKEARSQLQELGAVVRITLVVRPGSQAGKVLSSSPSEGSTVPSVVELKVADPGEAVALSELSPDDSANCSAQSSEVSLGSQSVTDNVSCPIVDEPSFIEYAIDGNALTLTFTAGYDTNRGRGSGMIRILGDNKLLKTVALASGVDDVSIDVGSVSSLRIEVSGTSEDAENNPASLVLGSAKLLGSAEGIASLRGGN